MTNYFPFILLLIFHFGAYSQKWQVIRFQNAYSHKETPVDSTFKINVKKYQVSTDQKTILIHNARGKKCSFSMDNYQEKTIKFPSVATQNDTITIKLKPTEQQAQKEMAVLWSNPVRDTVHFVSETELDELILSYLNYLHLVISYDDLGSCSYSQQFKFSLHFECEGAVFCLKNVTLLSTNFRHQTELTSWLELIPNLFPKFTFNPLNEPFYKSFNLILGV